MIKDALAMTITIFQSKLAALLEPLTMALANVRTDDEALEMGNPECQPCCKQARIPHCCFAHWLISFPEKCRKSWLLTAVV